MGLYAAPGCGHIPVRAHQLTHLCPHVYTHMPAHAPVATHMHMRLLPHLCTHLRTPSTHLHLCMYLHTAACMRASSRVSMRSSECTWSVMCISTHLHWCSPHSLYRCLCVYLRAHLYTQISAHSYTSGTHEHLATHQLDPHIAQNASVF